MNLLKGTVGEAGVSIAGDGSWPLPAGIEVAPGREVLYGIRPEALRLNPEGTPASVTVVEPTGAETHVVLEFAGRTLVMVVHDRLALRPGEVVRVAPDWRKAHLFDVDTLARIAPVAAAAA